MLLRHTLLYLPAQLIGPLAQFVAAVVWTHWMAPDDYGVLTFVMASQDLVFLVCLSWWSQYTLRYFGGLSGGAEVPYRESEASLLAATVVPQIATTLLLLLLVRIDVAFPMMIAACAYTVTRSLTNHFGERARTQSRILSYTVAQTAGPLAGFIVAFFLVTRVSATPEAALIGFAIPQALAFAGLFWALRVELGFRVPDRRLVLNALAFGLPIVFAGIAGWAGLNAIRFIVNAFAGAAALGLIAVGWGLGQRLTATVAMFMATAAFPLAVKSLHGGSREDAFRQITLGGLALFALVLPTAVGLWLVAEPLVTLFVAAPFRETTLAVLPYAAFAGAARNIRAHVADQIFLLIEKPRIAFMINVAEAIAVALCCFIGLELYGLGGAAAGCFAGAVSGVILGFGMARYQAGLHLPYADIGRIVIATLAMAAALSIMPWERMGAAPLVKVLAECFLGVFVYGAMLVLLFPAFVRGARHGLQRFPAQ